MLIALLAACSPEELWISDATEAAWLEDGGTEDLPERGRLASYGEARFTEAGEPLQGEPYDFFQENDVVVVEPGDRLRIVWQDSDVRLLLWLDPDDFVPVVHEGARAVAAPGRVVGRSGVWLPAGWTLDDWGSWLPTHVENPMFSGDVWVDGRDVEPYWVGGESAPEVVTDAYVRGGTAILDAPAGEVLVTTDAWEAFFVGAARLTERDGWVEVEIGVEGVRVVGWVPEEAVSEWMTGGKGWSSCCCGVGLYGGGRGWWGEWDIVPSGTELFAEGVLVGIARRDLRVRLAEDGSFTHATPWGEATLHPSLGSSPATD